MANQAMCVGNFDARILFESFGLEREPDFGRETGHAKHRTEEKIKKADLSHSNGIHPDGLHYVSHVSRRIPQRLQGLRLADAIRSLYFELINSTTPRDEGE